MDIDPNLIRDDVQRALSEDIGSGDVTSLLLDKNIFIAARLISREPMVVCGRAWVEQVFRALDPSVRLTWLVNEGAVLQSPTVLCHLEGNARSILSGERTALNFLQTLSGTATTTWSYVQRLRPYKTKLLDTRKTLPGLRLAQKYAVFCGGGCNHRLGLYDAFLIKENHIKACGSITQAVASARQFRPDLWIEVEVENLQELAEAIKALPHRIMLDNFDLGLIREAVRINRGSGCELEVSGGIEESTLEAIAKTGVNYISVGAITKSLRAIDLSLLVD